MRNFRLAKKKLDAIAKKIGFRKVHYLVLSRMLNKEFESMSVRFKFWTDIYMPWKKNYVVFSGGYNQPSDGTEYRYTIEMCRDPNDPYIKPRKAFFNEAYLVLVHELRHGYQYRTRRFKKSRAKDSSFKHFNRSVQDRVRYLSDYDEVDAYATEHAEALKINAPIDNRYDLLKTYAPKVWQRYQKKVYLLSHK
jgi:hypothetical protein